MFRETQHVSGKTPLCCSFFKTRLIAGHINSFQGRSKQQLWKLELRCVEIFSFCGTRNQNRNIKENISQVSKLSHNVVNIFCRLENALSVVTCVPSNILDISYMKFLPGPKAVQKIFSTEFSSSKKN